MLVRFNGIIDVLFKDLEEGLYCLTTSVLKTLVPGLLDPCSPVLLHLFLQKRRPDLVTCEGDKVDLLRHALEVGPYLGFDECGLAHPWDANWHHHHDSLYTVEI